MAHFPDHMDRDEARVSNRLITAILDHPDNLAVRVFDGEQWATHWTRDRATIQRETAATDVTIYHLCKVSDTGAATRFGSITLIHGNGEDVVSDAAWSSKRPEAEALIEGLCDHANRT